MSLRIAAVAAVVASCLASACSAEESNDGTRRSTPTGGTDAGASPSPAMDGGTSDAATTVPPDAAAPDECAGRAVCETFEGATGTQLPYGGWKASTAQGGAVAITTERAYRGTHAIKVSTGATTYQRAMFELEGQPVFPLAQGELFGRMMVWLDNPAKDGVHWTMIDAVGPVEGKTNVTGFYRFGGQQQGKLMANYDTSNASTDCWQHSQTVMPTKTWVCFAFRFAKATNELELWMNGQPVTDVHVKGTGQGCIGNAFAGQWLAPTFAKASVGWESYQADVGHTMYVDDVVLDDTAVGCPTPP